MNWILIFVTLQVLHFLGTWRLYQKAGRKSWETALPIYSLWVMLKITGRPRWWIVLFFIPIICVVLYGVLWVDFIRCFGKRSSKDTFLVIITLGFYIYYINYLPRTKFTGVEERKETALSSLLFAVVFASFVHTYLIQPFTIPTPSMERTLLVGDFMFVSKFHYGLRIPLTPIGFPFTHNTIPIIGIRSYIDRIRLPYKRLPALTPIRPGDIVVFNFPTDSTQNAPDRKDHYIKRCIALPGDTLEIISGELQVNGQPEALPKNAEKQYSYIVQTKEIRLNEDFLKNYLGIKDIKLIEGDESGDRGALYEIMLTDEYAKILSELDNVTSIEKHLFSKEFTEPGIFPENSTWNRDFYGPLYVPKKGDIIKLSENNISQYRDIITRYEGHTLKESEGEFFIDNRSMQEYVIEQNYYFMMGDNRHNSLDSRYWGFVPQDHIVGKPIFTWLSIDWDRDHPLNIFKWKLRQERIITLTNENSRIKTSYLPYVLTSLGIYFVYSFIKERRKKKKNTSSD
ncbi:signal peptidase I [Bacteroidetes bacterium endosymbiont of Geopemphigus sp.]|uniref:signal peptidase I n=1 Tax=Bacteroidetes bacterium endosymbiont of Geopemphigus sp. TaxID=2047937 RepID=UPI000CD1640D|nr:signal peptidase I [Bacteroidetes bacterium endosymbiont of Geopemphigus sp.]